MSDHHRPVSSNALKLGAVAAAVLLVLLMHLRPAGAAGKIHLALRDHWVPTGEVALKKSVDAWAEENKVDVIPVNDEVATLMFERGDMTFARGQEWNINIDQCAQRGPQCGQKTAATLWCQFKFGRLSVATRFAPKDQQAGDTWLLQEKVMGNGKTFQWITCATPEPEFVLSKPEMGSQ
jgi:hypothetical protein